MKEEKSEKKKCLEKADVFILPLFSESMQHAMLEESAYGMALSGTNFGAVDQILVNGINGFFIEAGNVYMLFDTTKIFIQNQGLASKMGSEYYNE